MLNILYFIIVMVVIPVFKLLAYNGYLYIILFYKKILSHAFILDFVLTHSHRTAFVLHLPTLEQLQSVDRERLVCSDVLWLQTTLCLT